MYLRTVHTDLHLPTLYAFIRSNPLGILTTAPRGDYAATSPAPTLKAKALVEAACNSSSNSSNGQVTPSNTLPQETIILFNGPAPHYVTPKFYVATKPDTGKVVPTWDYSAVQVYGTATIHLDTSLPATGTFLATQLDDLSRQSEERVLGFTETGGAGRPGRGAWTRRPRAR
ncbi:uncharacterized protein L3040_007597 [Drepanopeziza brunnea f. sp. 'multigermtubi']|uniref:uncharacterized protein n=1 Tax=Drepanopeziza brunnea f. sp. 'multigermtubi' TaxID=698441 RepID=UPI0023989FC4|nr:hypothetical protein L3040_007597 [Drepanopeziza brunnea f. sp. 'multigermtubi']